MIYVKWYMKDQRYMPKPMWQAMCRVCKHDVHRVRHEALKAGWQFCTLLDQSLADRVALEREYHKLGLTS